jgi:hypothetical protein
MYYFCRVKRQLGIPRRRWEGNIKMYLQEVGRVMDWMDLAEDWDRWRAVISAVLKLGV